MHDVSDARARLPQMAAFSSTFEMEVPSGILSVGLQSPMVSSALASRCTSHRATCPRSWTSEPSNFRTSTGVDACAGFAALRTSARLMDAHFEASFSECRATPTSNDTFRSKSVRRDLGHCAMRSTCKISQTWPVQKCSQLPRTVPS